MDAFQSLFQLQWRKQQPQVRPLPRHVERKYVRTEQGDLEVLICRPGSLKTNAAAERPIFFVHGGFGSAGVWLEWMAHLYGHDYPGTLYAYSARNHGASFSVSYARMVLGTTVDDIAGDLGACLRWAQQDSGVENMTLVAHSAGGGVAQYALSKRLFTVHALCLVGAVPHFGMLDMYWSWLKHDPWYPIRTLLHLGHPLSPLSTPELVRGAFFGERCDRADVLDLIRWMPKYESLRWPIAQFGSLFSWLQGRNEWLGVDAVLAGVESSRSPAGAAVCVLAGERDMMLDCRVIQRVAKEYREAMRKGGRGAEDRGNVANQHTVIDGAVTSTEHGVLVVLVGKAGHHVQNDIQAAVGARALLEWARRITKTL